MARRSPADATFTVYNANKINEVNDNINEINDNANAINDANDNNNEINDNADTMNEANANNEFNDNINVINDNVSEINGSTNALSDNIMLDSLKVQVKDEVSGDEINDKGVVVQEVALMTK